MLIHIPPSAVKYHLHMIHDFQRIRKTVFNDQMGWNAKTVDDREVDGFDSDNSRYLLSAYKGDVVGGVRLTPSEVPNITYDELAKNFEGFPIDRNAKVLEAGKFCLELNKNKDLMSEMCTDLFIAMLNFSVSHGYEKLVMVIDVNMEPLFNMYGWEIERVTDIVQIGEVQTVGVILPIQWKYIDSIKSLKTKKVR